jgi:hypothetical protein
LHSASLLAVSIPTYVEFQSKAFFAFLLCGDISFSDKPSYGTRIPFYTKNATPPDFILINRNHPINIE